MPDETPNGSTDQPTPSPADTSNDGMPTEVAEFLSGMAADLGTAPEGESSRETPGNDDDGDDIEGRPADAARGPESDPDDEDDPTTDDDGTESGAGDDGDGEDAAPADASDRVKAAWKKLSRSERAAILSDADRRAEERTKADRDRADRLQKERDDAAAKVAEIRGRNARFIGLEETKRPDGTVVPSYDEITRLLKARGGDDVLEEKYGLSRDEAQEQIEVWDERREMVEGNQDWFDTQAWGRLSYLTTQGLKRIEGLDADAVMNGISTPDQVIDKVVEHLTARHAAEKEALIRRYEARLKGAGLNAEGLKGQVLAGSSKEIDRGGRPGGGRVMTRERLERALSNPDEFEKNRDAIYDRLGIT